MTNAKTDQTQKHFETRACTAGVAQDTAYASVAPPLHLSANFGWRNVDDKPAFDYSRSGESDPQGSRKRFS